VIHFRETYASFFVFLFLRFLSDNYDPESSFVQ
jgi:hypothetical protein